MECCLADPRQRPRATLARVAYNLSGTFLGASDPRVGVIAIFTSHANRGGYWITIVIWGLRCFFLFDIILGNVSAVLRIAMYFSRAGYRGCLGNSRQTMSEVACQRGLSGSDLRRIRWTGSEYLGWNGRGGRWTDWETRDGDRLESLAPSNALSIFCNVSGL